VLIKRIRIPPCTALYLIGAVNAMVDGQLSSNSPEVVNDVERRVDN
jgi:hypothetical protein